jgi:hypothetical protein
MPLTFREKGFEQWMLAAIHGKRQVSMQNVIVLVHKPTYIIGHCACIMSQSANKSHEKNISMKRFENKLPIKHGPNINEVLRDKYIYVFMDLMNPDYNTVSSCKYDISCV